MMAEIPKDYPQYGRRIELLSALGVSLLTIALFLLRYGYDYGISDQEEFLPAVKYMQEGLFQSDWFVNDQARFVNVRTPTVILIFLLSKIVAIPTAVSLLFTLALAGLSVSIFFIARRFGANRFMSMAAVVTALVLTPQWTLGGNDLAQSLLTPSMMAWPLALGGVALYLHHRRYSGTILLGLAAYLQPLVSMQTAGVFFLAILLADWITLAATREATIRWVVCVLLYVAIVAPFLIGILSVPTSDVAAPTVFHILADMRAPHHYLFSQFPLRNVALFLSLMIAGTAGLAAGSRPVRHAGLAGLAIVLALCLVGYIFTELVPLLPVLKLQLFKSTVFAKVICVVGIASGLSALPLVKFASETRRSSSPMSFAIACGLAGFILITGQAFFTPSKLLVGEARALDGLASLERWAAKETPKDAIFLVPPSNSRFRLAAGRSIVVNFKAFPFQDGSMVAWRDRLQDVGGPIPTHLPTGQRLQILDDVYEGRSPSQLLDLASRYRVDYVVRRTPLPRQTRRFRTLFISHDGWRLYEILSDDSG